MKVRVVYKPDGQVSIIRPMPNSQRLGESELDFLNRVFSKSMTANGFDGYEYEDKDESEISANRSARSKWRHRVVGGKKEIYTNTKIKLRGELLDEKEAALNAELAKSTPDVITVAKLQRSLENLKKTDPRYFEETP